MSDTSQGPDWWLASEGKWYPPPTETPERAGRSTPSLGRWLAGAWGATAVLGASTAITAATARDAAQTWIGEDTASAALDWKDLDGGATGALNLLSLAAFVTLVVTIAWLWGAHKQQDALDPERRSWGAGWAIVGWFVPIANLLVPKLVLNEVERIASTPVDEAGGVGDRWRSQRVAWLGRLWWLGWIVGFTSIGVATVVWDGVIELTELESIDRSAVLDAYTWRIVGGVAMAVAGVAGAVHLRRVSRAVARSSA